MDDVRVYRLMVAEPGVRLDKYVAEQRPELSRARVQQLIDAGHITVNGHQVKSSYKLVADDRLSITIPPPPPTCLIPESMPLAILYEDDDVLVVDKPAGLITHPASGNQQHTLVNAILAHFPALAEMGSFPRPGIVHRLDKDTSGVMVVAKQSLAQLNLAAQFREHSVVKVYLVLVRGHLTPEAGVIEADIGRDGRNRKRMAVVRRGREARTEYQVKKYPGNFTLLEVRTHTGRTHQIRVHLAAIGHPVVGDATYGIKVPFLSRQFLHAHRLGFRLSSTGEYREFTSELPSDLVQALRSIG
jgi:23S rRNA pseudouridine1911/1915/1917 synthase